MNKTINDFKNRVESIINFYDSSNQAIDELFSLSIEHKNQLYMDLAELKMQIKDFPIKEVVQKTFEIIENLNKEWNILQLFISEKVKNKYDIKFYSDMTKDDFKKEAGIFYYQALFEGML